MIPARSSQLTSSEETFCREFAATRNALVAYAKAFPGYKDTRIQRLESAAMLKNPIISGRIDELTESVSSVNAFTFEEHMYELQKIRDAAMASNQMKVALEAEVTRGKLVGFYKGIDDEPKVEKHLHLHEAERNVTDEQRASAVLQLFRNKVVDIDPS